MSQTQWHPAIPHVDARFRKRARETYISHISGIRTLENQLISMQTLDSQARAQDTHQWHHSTSKPAIPHVDAPFQKRARETNISGITASHESPFTPFPHVDAQFHKHSCETHIRGVIAFLRNPLLHADRCDSTSTRSRHTSRIIKASHSPCRRWISQAPTRKT